MKEFNFVEYVEEQIEMFKMYSKMYEDGSHEFSSNEINNALLHFTGVSSALSAEYQFRKKNLATAKKDFQIWLDSKFIEAKKKVMEGKPASFKPAKTEIDIYMRYSNVELWKKYSDLIEDGELAVRFLRRLLEQWKQHGQIMIALSHNMRSEMQSFGITNAVNKRLENEKSKQAFQRKRRVSKKEN